MLILGEPYPKRLKLADFAKQENIIYNAWSAPLDSIPSVSTLKSLLNNPEFPAPIPVNCALEDSVVVINESSRLKNVFEITLNHISPNLALLYCLIMNTIQSGGSEDLWHHIYDSRIKEIFMLLSNHCGINIRCDRNKADSFSSHSTVKKQNRPDFLLWLSNGLLILKGEEKCTYEAFEVAKVELTDKAWICHPFYIDDNFPYQLCYVAAGGLVQFFCLNLLNGNVEPISKQFNLLLSSVDRAELLLTVITIFRVIRTLHNNITLKPKLILNNKIVSNEGKTTITFHEDHIKKVTSLFTGECIFELYKKISGTETTNIIRPHNNRPPKPIIINSVPHISLRLSPLGNLTCPCNLEEMKKAAVDILNGMTYIHLFGFVIRDIRPPNVLRDINGSYFLIDFEWAVPIGSHSNEIEFILEPPEIKKSGSWEITADIWQYGK